MSDDTRLLLDENYFGLSSNSNITVNNSDTLKYILMMCIYEALQEEFEYKFFSGNLKNTISLTENPSIIGDAEEGENKVQVLGSNNYTINIVARAYDFNVFKNTGQIVHNSKFPGSYADQVDITGGFSGSHKNYVERCIKKGIEKWKAMFPDLEISSNL